MSPYMPVAEQRGAFEHRRVSTCPVARDFARSTAETTPNASSSTAAAHVTDAGCLAAPDARPSRANVCSIPDIAM